MHLKVDGRGRMTVPKELGIRETKEEAVNRAACSNPRL